MSRTYLMMERAVNRTQIGLYLLQKALMCSHQVDSLALYIFLKTLNFTDYYTVLKRPQPAAIHANYPFYTYGGRDKRWLGPLEYEEMGRQWVGGMMCVS